MNETGIEDLLARYRRRLDSIRSLFHTVNGEFCFYFGSLDSHSKQSGFEHLGLFMDLVANYRSVRWSLEELEDLIAKFDSLAESDNCSESSLRRLSSALSEMASLNSGRDEDEGGFETWQRASKAFMEFLACEQGFMDNANRLLDTLVVQHAQFTSQSKAQL